MIRQVEIKGFRAIRFASVDLDSFLILVGPNGGSTLKNLPHCHAR